MRAVRIDEFGGPEVLQRRPTMPVPGPAEGQVLVRVELAGVNFGDTHQRENRYVAERKTPFVLGGEVAGTVARPGTASRRASGWSR